MYNILKLIFFFRKMKRERGPDLVNDIQKQGKPFNLRK